MTTLSLSPSSPISVSRPDAANFSARPVADAQQTAAQIADLFRQGRSGEATLMLNNAQRDQPVAVQEALERLVSADLRMSMAPDLPLGMQSAYASPVEVGQAIQRINQAGAQTPDMPDTAGLNTQQRFDVYNSFIQLGGNQAAREALAAGDNVILGLRSPNNSLDNGGQGVYDDRLVVLSRQPDGRVAVEEFTRASTEPTAQYDGNLRNSPELTAFRRPEGTDLTGDGTPEMGSIRTGTMEMIETTHPNPSSAGTDFSLRPSAAAVAANPQGVQRDNTHDGWFNAADAAGIAPLNDTFKIHSGSRSNTDSAGCTTVHPEDYGRLQAALTADPAQSRWQYVLAEVRP